VWRNCYTSFFFDFGFDFEGIKKVKKKKMQTTIQHTPVTPLTPIQLLNDKLNRFIVFQHQEIQNLRRDLQKVISFNESLTNFVNVMKRQQLVFEDHIEKNKTMYFIAEKHIRNLEENNKKQELQISLLFSLLDNTIVTKKE
jgi:hypothetical protein